MRLNKLILAVLFLCNAVIPAQNIFSDDSLSRKSINDIDLGMEINKNVYPENTSILLIRNETKNRYWVETKNKIYLNSKPSNAKVFFRDSLLGYTPIYLSDEFKDISLVKDNYKSELINLMNENISPVNLQYVGILKRESFFKSNMFKILIGSAVFLGGSAAYFKLKADKEFENYELTGNKKYLERTDNYDLISGISLGALQINFGVLVYYFFKD